MARTLVTTPDMPETQFVYCDKCRKGEPYKTRRPGWRLSNERDFCPECPAPIVPFRPS